MFDLVRYTAENKGEWNQFVANAKNATFLFDRNYMDYHSDRFEDCSLMVCCNGKVYALLPANRVGNVLYSHQGLTYGGLIMNDKTTTAECVELFREVNSMFKAIGITRVVYKPTPYIYHRHPSQEDLYALFRTTNARIVGRNISSTIVQDEKIKFRTLRRRGVAKAIANGLTVMQSDDFPTFWRILSDNLMARYNAKPVHSLEEIKLLRSRFPDNIKLYMAYKDGEALGGTLVYITPQVIHTQYISANVEGKRLGALDLVFSHLINEEYVDCKYFDFGQSTEQMGNLLNESLIFQKEGFGGRGVCYDIYEYGL